ncbi:glycosyltransferase family 2 protein [Sphingomonas yabuuchiae]|uniref:glycosyltransferase family 2 protein n=1 Tax=Sphingomonas yabuuchiae TaxID=172044 RepID=UPI000735EAD6|nr:glycosyltransferase family 2 protein [Sphingomonas yabuuchiae]
MTPMPFRDAIQDDAETKSTLYFEGVLPDQPVFTIAIPTFNRPELFRETLHSALSQNTSIPFEIVIIDNASEPANVQNIVQHLGSLGPIPVRYYVNDTNIGMFGNWNRCISLARGPWFTILSDDDILLPNYMSTMFTRIDLNDPSRSYACCFGNLDQREQKPRSEFVTRVLTLIKRFLRFGFSKAIHVTAKRMYWSNIAGSSLGAIYSVATAKSIGGFYPEDFPSADYFFHVRAILTGKMVQFADELVRVRMQVNETMNPSTSLRAVAVNHRLRMALVASRNVPQKWADWSAILLAYDRIAAKRIWGVSLDADALFAQTGVPEKPKPSILVWLKKAIMGGV